MLIGNSIEEQVWNYLISMGLAPCGVAGIMGNMNAESGMLPNRVETLCLKKLKEKWYDYTNETYTAAVDSGKITRKQFLNPLSGCQYGYGIVQWTSPDRKAGLYDLCKSRGVSIADLEAQLEWLMLELNVSYKKVLNVLKAANSVQEASDYVLCNFEQPDDCSASVRAYRASLGQEYYDKYHNSEVVKVGLRQKVIDLVNSQAENAGGEKYWSWWGYQSRVLWCQIFVSWIMWQAGVPVDVYGKYENCQYAIGKMKEKGIWHARGYRPQPGDVCYYDWGSDGESDHVGIVVAVSGDTVTVREGNKSDKVGNRKIAYNDMSIVGYASPNYDNSTSTTVQKGDSYMFEVGMVQNGTKGNDVKLLQRLLSSNGCKGADGKALTIDGDCGANTVAAIKTYQKGKGLSVDGIAGPNTWKSILLR